MNLFNLSTRPKMELPEPTGEKKIFQEKVFIPVQQHPEVSAHYFTSNLLIIIRFQSTINRRHHFSIFFIRSLHDPPVRV